PPGRVRAREPRAAEVEAERAEHPDVAAEALLGGVHERAVPVEEHGAQVRRGHGACAVAWSGVEKAAIRNETAIPDRRPQRTNRETTAMSQSRRRKRPSVSATTRTTGVSMRRMIPRRRPSGQRPARPTTRRAALAASPAVSAV